MLNQFTVQSGAGGLRFWGTGLALSPRLQALLLTLERPEGTDVEVLKSSTRRSVFRVRNVAPDVPSLVVKGFPLAKIESRLKYRKYGLAEFVNHREAIRLGIPVPLCHGYFEVRSLGLVKANGVVIEDLAGWRSLAELAAANPGKQRELLSLAIPLLKQLYETGVNHIDTSPQNMLHSPDGGDLRLIDWQYCSFVRPQQPVQLLLQAAHFLSYANLSADSTGAREWLAQLAAACGWPKPVEGLRSAVAALHARGRIDAPTRLELSPDPEVLALLKTA